MSYSDLYATLPTARSIRLLRLQSGPGEDQLACSLEVVEDFETGPAYHALSYCWGDANDLVGLLCNEHRIYITKNLYAALHRLRRREQDLPIWADAICIDQRKVAERNQQVSIMDRIYSNASTVYVWLGHGDTNTPRAITMVQRIVQRMHAAPGTPADETDSWLMDFIDPNARGEIDSWVTRLAASGDSISIVLATAKLEATDFDVQDWKAFYKFYEAEWFSRVWVVQEVQQGKDAQLLCGDFELPWDWVGLAAAKVRADAVGDHVFDWTRFLFQSLEPFLNAETMWNRVFWTRRQSPFLSLLDMGRMFRATDPRDKVFAMLHHRIKQNDIDEVETIPHARLISDSIMKESSATHLNIEANYRMTMLNVYREVAVQSIQLYGNLEVLCYAWETEPYDPLWPSWVPRWDICSGQGVPALTPFLYDADRQHRAKFDVYYSSNTLKVHGFQIGTVREKSHVVKYQGTENDSRWKKKDRVNEELESILSLVTRDCWRPNRYDENDSCRTGDHNHMAAQFSDFCSFALGHLKTQKHDCYISLFNLWCDTCDADLVSLGGGAVSSPVTIYHCANENFDMCSDCFQKGMRPPDPSWILQPTSPIYMWLPYTRHVIKALKKHAGDGQRERFFHQAANCCNRTTFFHTSEGDQGSASENVEVGDVVVVLLGSRVPMILRQSGSAYRLISDAYVEGFMDGKAVDMFENGELERRSFEIK